MSVKYGNCILSAEVKALVFLWIRKDLFLFINKLESRKENQERKNTATKWKIDLRKRFKDSSKKSFQKEETQWREKNSVDSYCSM